MRVIPMEIRYWLYVNRQPLFLLALVCITALYFLYAYLPFTAVNFLLGACVLPFLVQSTGKRVNYTWFLLPVLLFTVIVFYLPVQTLIYAVCAWVIAFVANTYWNSRVLPLAIVLFLMTPIASYLAGIFTFPIRIELTQLVATIFQWLGSAITVSGNTIHYRGNDFTVDAACMGLKMLEVSLIMAVFLQNHYERRMQCRLAWPYVLLLLLTVVALNICANLFRIFILVSQRWMPDTVEHEVTGLVCLLIYVLLPAMWIAKKLVSQKGRPFSADVTTAVPGSAKWKTGLLLVLLLAGAFQLKYGHPLVEQFKEPAQVGGYQRSTAAEGIWRYYNGQTLAYVKGVRGFFDTDHQPMLCWKGSGYTFSHTTIQKIGNYEVYTAELNQGGHRLFTAWWYTNGKQVTLSQWEWRMAMARGSLPYYLLNVTSSNAADLERAVLDWQQAALVSSPTITAQ